MNIRGYQKKLADARRIASRKYGFRQCSYINFKVESGYFFCLYFFNDEARFTVKPMYADDLWWDIWDASENKQEPLSLRGIGAYALSGQVLTSYKISETVEGSEFVNQFEPIFQEAIAVMSTFLTDNPDSDIFYPDESKMEYDPDRLLYLMALIHNGRDEEALAIIKDARKNKHRCMFQCGMFSDSYTYIRRWCNRKPIFGRLRKWTLKYLTCSDASDNKRRVSIGRDAEKLKRKPWYRRLLYEWLYWILLAPIYIPVLFYFFDLHKRTLYDVPWWIWLVGFVLFIGIFIVILTKNGINRDGLLTGILISVTCGWVTGLIFTGMCIGLFDGINRLFADHEPVVTTAVVTNGKFYHKSRGRFNFSHYVTIVELATENRMMKIDDVDLYKVPPQSEVIITYRRGLFGVDIFDKFTFSDKD